MRSGKKLSSNISMSPNLKTSRVINQSASAQSEKLLNSRRQTVWKPKSVKVGSQQDPSELRTANKSGKKRQIQQKPRKNRRAGRRVQAAKARALANKLEIINLDDESNYYSEQADERSSLLFLGNQSEHEGGHQERDKIDEKMLIPEEVQESEHEPSGLMVCDTSSEHSARFSSASDDSYDPNRGEEIHGIEKLTDLQGDIGQQPPASEELLQMAIKKFKSRLDEDIAVQKQDQLEIVPMFAHISAFQGGTFCYEKNDDFDPHPQLLNFKTRILKPFDEQSLRLDTRFPSGHDSKRQKYIDKEVRLRSPKIEHFRTYVPIFPYMYQTLDEGRALGDQMHLNLLGSRTVTSEHAIYGGKPDVCHRKAQLKFSLRNNPLLRFEETREKALQIQQKELGPFRSDPSKKPKFTDYMANFDFENIKSVWLWYRQPENDVFCQYSKGASYKEFCDKHHVVTLLFQLDKPAVCLKSGPVIDGEMTYPKKESHLIRSPFNMTSNDSEVSQQAGHVQEDYSEYVNYWNNNQVFLFRGLANREGLKTFFKTLRMVNKNCKISQVEGYHDQKLDGIVLLKAHEEKGEKLKLLERAKRFRRQMVNMRQNLRFSILALLSQNKFNIFNQGLIDFMQLINQGGWNENELNAEFGSYCIDHINTFKDLDYKDNSCTTIIRLFEELSTNETIQDDFQRLMAHADIQRQRRVLVTPTLHHYTYAREEEGNKVLRQFKADSSSFIRLSFVTDDLEKGFYNSRNSSYILGYIHSIMTRGLYAGRDLQMRFLSYSNSQLKNHTCWFIAQISSTTKIGLELWEPKIINSLGDFRKETNILKRYARRGQCFSTTKKVCPLENERVCIGYPDDERNGQCFSDGCGWISEDLARNVANYFEYDQISAFQIRVGGAKGILAVNRDKSIFQQDGKNYKILLRQSQVKFPSENLTLEVVRCATFSQGYLNRQVILLLHCLGAPASYFLKKQHMAAQLCNLEKSMNRIQTKISKIQGKYGALDDDCPESLENSRKEMRLKDLAKDIRFTVDPCKTFQPLIRQSMLKGKNMSKDPTFSSLLQCNQLQQQMSMRKKCRILLPESCVLIGIVDPTGTLEADEIFVQIRRDNFSQRDKKYDQIDQFLKAYDQVEQLISGDVLVTRNPCVHPGDVRRLRAVGKPELQHLYNVVVFSSKGERPACNMMSGGDLDGDVYFVTWDQELLSYVKHENILEPAAYDKDYIVEKPDGSSIADYFIFYLARDVLGILSNLWMAIADMNGQFGPRSAECYELAKLCSVAVDFAKHGECVSRSNYKDIQDLVVAKPDFLEKEKNFGATFYKSKGVLGKLHQNNQHISLTLEAFYQNEWKNSIKYDYELDPLILGMVPDADREVMHSLLEPIFTSIVIPMTEQLKKLLSQFHLASESELFAANLQWRLCYEPGADDNNFYKGDPGSKNEDIIKNLNVMRYRCQDKYSFIFRQFAEGIEHPKRDLLCAVALYIATYFELNDSCIKYNNLHKFDKGLANFLIAQKRQYESSIKDQKEEIKVFEETIRTNKEQFYKVIIEAEKGDGEQMRKLQQVKKVFCIPWLLAGDTLLQAYPNLIKEQTGATGSKKAGKNKKQANHPVIHKEKMMRMEEDVKMDIIFSSVAEPEQKADEKENVDQNMSAQSDQFMQMLTQNVTGVKHLTIDE